jgi:hypothetical protein
LRGQRHELATSLFQLDSFPEYAEFGKLLILSAAICWIAFRVSVKNGMTKK